MANLGRESLWVGESQAVYIQEEDSAADIFFNGPGEDFGVPMGLKALPVLNMVILTWHSKHSFRTFFTPHKQLRESREDGADSSAFICFI